MRTSRAVLCAIFVLTSGCLDFDCGSDDGDVELVSGRLRLHLRPVTVDGRGNTSVGPKAAMQAVCERVGELPVRATLLDPRGNETVVEVDACDHLTDADAFVPLVFNSLLQEREAYTFDIEIASQFLTGRYQGYVAGSASQLTWQQIDTPSVLPAWTYAPGFWRGPLEIELQLWTQLGRCSESDPDVDGDGLTGCADRDCVDDPLCGDVPDAGPRDTGGSDAGMDSGEDGGDDSGADASGACNGVPLAAGERCCGSAAFGEAYDPTQEVCCDPASGDTAPIGQDCEVVRDTCGDVARVDDDEECCGQASGVGTWYSGDTEQCCDATTGTVAAFPGNCPPPAILTCGGTPYVPPLDCCGSALFVTAAEQCCDAATSTVRSSTESCEDERTYGIWAWATACGGDIFVSDITHGIVRVDGTTLTYALWEPAGFAAGSVCDGDALIYSDINNGIFRKPLRGGEATLLVGDSTTAAYDLVLVDRTLGWVRNNTLSDVWAYDIDTTTLRTIATNQQLPQHLAADDEWVYYIERSGFSPVVRRVRLDGSGGQPQIVMTELTRVDDGKELQVYDGVLYVAAYGSGRIYARPSDGTGSVSTFADLETRPYAMTTDGIRLFWRDETTGTIRARNLDGSDTPSDVLTVPEGGNRGDVVVSEDRVYAVDTRAHLVRSAPR